MRSHRFINSPLYLVIQLVEKESKVNENNAGIRHFFVLFLEKRYISQVIHFNLAIFKTRKPEAEFWRIRNFRRNFRVCSKNPEIPDFLKFRRKFQILDFKDSPLI